MLTYFQVFCQPKKGWFSLVFDGHGAPILGNLFSETNSKFAQTFCKMKIRFDLTQDRACKITERALVYCLWDSNIKIAIVVSLSIKTWNLSWGNISIAIPRSWKLGGNFIRARWTDDYSLKRVKNFFCFLLLQMGLKDDRLQSIDTSVQKLSSGNYGSF